MGVSNSSPRFTRTLPAPSAVHADGFVFLLSTAWFTQAGGDSGSPIDGGATSLANGGGNMMAFSDVLCTNRLPIHVVTFVAGVSPDALVYVRTPSYTAGDTITIGRDDTQTTQPLPAAAFGQYNVWQDYELTILQGTADDAAGNHSPFTVGSPSLVSAMYGGQGYKLDTNTKWIQVAHDVGLNIERNYSIDFWIIRNAGSVKATAYVDKTNAANTDGFKMLGYGNNGLRTRHPNLTPSNLDSAENGGNVAMLSSDMDGTTRRNIVNGVVSSSDTPTGTVTTVTDDFYIGHSIAFNTDLFRHTLGNFFLRKSSTSNNKRSSEYLNQSDPDNFGTSSEWSVPSGTGVNLLKVGSLDVVDVKLYKGAVYTPVTLYLGDTLVWQEE